MTNIQTTKANHYFRALVALAVLTMTASLLAVMAVRPASASTTFTVNYPYDTSDATSADSLCDVATFIPGEQCTLRAAIQQANATQGADAIHFGIPDSYGAGVKTIHVGATSPSNGELPPITDTVTIDGYTQPGSSENTLAKGTNAKIMIELEGSQVGTPGFGLRVNAPDVVIKGLVINRFHDYGIYVNDAAANTKMEGNFIGTDPSGTKAQGIVNGTGVVIDDGSGVTNNTVGGSVAARNLISGNNGPGIALFFKGNAVYGNLVGTQRDGKSPLGNTWSGLYISGDNNAVGKAAASYANTIAFNEHQGVYVPSYNGESSVGNSIISNSIFSNGLIGTELGNGEGPTPNDVGDADAGSNNLQNYPVLSSAMKSTTGKTTVKGKLNSNPNKTFKVQFFSNPKGTNEGQKLLGSKSVTTDGAGNVAFTFATTNKTVLGQNITATASDTVTSDTSEFSAPRKVVAP
jgi:hypothetical protein